MTEGRRSTKDPAALEAAVRALDPWFHDLDLGNGLRTKREACADEPVDHPRPTWGLVRPLLPADLSGLDVLDVGCNAGFYSFELKRLGARRVLGVDAQRREIAQARLAAEALGLDVSFARRSVYDLSIADEGRFDVVLALGLLYHCRHPLLALERLAEVTRGTLLVESAVAPPEWARPPEAHLIGGLPRRPVPAFFLENDADSKEAVFNWFLPTAACLASLLRAVGFDGVREAPAGEGRALLVAERGAGAPGAGGLHHRARITASASSVSVAPGAPFPLTVSLWNTGTAAWAASTGRETERGSVLLGVHLLDADENVLEWDFRRYRFPLDVEVRPGERVDLALELKAPESPGACVLELDLVREFEGWFEDFGGAPFPVRLTVGAG